MTPGNNRTSDSDLESVVSYQDARPISRRRSTGPKYNCTIEGCDAVFMRLDAFDRHEYKHTGIKKHACIYEGCEKTYSILTHLKRHVRTTHERTEPPQKNVSCTQEGCQKMFSSLCNMKRHIREVHKNPKIYHCSHCGEKFTQKLKMRRHEITKHTKSYPFSCSKCQKGFYQQWNCERHMVNCKVYPCSNCDLKFEKWSLYLKHCKENQHGRKYYKCEHCSRTYSKPGELNKHIAAKHLDGGEPTPFKCTYSECERSYVHERNLKQHILTVHTGKDFKCDEINCERSFTSAQNLKKHLEREHNAKSEAPKQDAVPVKRKTSRKKRKDAGRSLISHLTKFSCLAVDRNLDKLLRERDSNALEIVCNNLNEETEVDEAMVDLAVMKSFTELIDSS